MKKIIIILTLISWLIPSMCLAVKPQIRMGSVFGFLHGGYNPAGSNIAQDAANKWFAYSFVPSESKTISAFTINWDIIYGTQANISVSAEIYSDVNYIPGASVAGPITITNQAAGMKTWPGFTYAVTAGTRYWVVFKNTAAAPTVDYPSYYYSTSETGPIYAYNSVYWGWDFRGTTNGTAWATPSNSNCLSLTITYSTGEKEGLVIGSPVTSAVLYGTHVAGVKFTTPANATLIVKGAGFFHRINSATGNLYYRLQVGVGGTIYDTAQIPVSNFSTSTTGYYAFFSTPVTIPPGTVCRLWAKDTNADSAGANYSLVYYVSIDDAVNLPYSIYYSTSANQTDWTDVQTGVAPFWLLLDTNGEFGAVSGGSGGVTGY